MDGSKRSAHSNAYSERPAPRHRRRCTCCPCLHARPSCHGSLPADSLHPPPTHPPSPVYGFGKAKRIVLFDTLVQTCTEEEVVAVLAHGGRLW